MQFDTTLSFRNLDGVVVKEQFLKPGAKSEKDKETATVDVRVVTTGIAMAQCLLAPSQDTPATQLSDRYLLALKMRDEASINLSADQLTICKSCANKHPDALISSQLCLYLDGKHPEWNEAPALEKVPVKVKPNKR